MSQELGLADRQRGLLALLKDRPAAFADDAYLEQVRHSRGLSMHRAISAWWRRFDLGQAAPLTTRALEHAGRLEETLGRLGRDPAAPTAIDALGAYLLDRHVKDVDPLIAAVASTERALILVVRGDSRRHEVAWDRNPAPVLNALMDGRPPEHGRPGAFRVIISNELPALITVET